MTKEELKVCLKPEYMFGTTYSFRVEDSEYALVIYEWDNRWFGKVNAWHRQYEGTCFGVTFEEVIEAVARVLTEQGY